jgi:hypothetical protein
MTPSPSRATERAGSACKASVMAGTARDDNGRDLRTAARGLDRSKGKAWGLGYRFPLVERAVTQEAFGAPGLQGFGAPKNGSNR